MYNIESMDIGRCFGVGGAHLQVLVCLLLVFRRHGCWGSAGCEAGAGEEHEAGHHAECGVACNLPAFSWRRESAGAVSAEGDPVC